MDKQKIADRLANSIVAEQTEYQQFFQKKLEEHDVSSPSELDDDEKKKFFDEVDKGWKSEDEKD